MRRVVRHELGDAVDLSIGHGKHPPDIAQHGARLQLAEGDDLRDAVAAVFLLDVANDLITAILAEIDVEIRHRHALGIEKALEQQPETQRVQIGDREGPSDDGAGARAAPRPDRDTLPLRPLDEIGDDQEIAGEPSLDDHVELEFETLAVGPERFVVCRGKSGARVAGGETPARRGAQRAHLVLTRRQRERRQDRLPSLRDESAAPGDDHCVFAGLRQIGEQCPHLFRRAEEMLGGQAPPVVIRDDAALRDAHKGVMRLVEIAVGEIGIVCRDERQVMGIGEIDESRLAAQFLGQTVALHFDVEPSGKDVLQR